MLISLCLNNPHCYFISLNTLEIVDPHILTMHVTLRQRPSHRTMGSAHEVFQLQFANHSRVDTRSQSSQWHRMVRLQEDLRAAVAAEHLTRNL